MAGYEISAADMQRAIQGFSTTAANAKKTMSDLENDLVSTLNAYAGDQATAFWSLHTQLQEKMTQASQELDTMSGLVNSANTNYNTGDATASSSYRNVASNVDAGGAALNRLRGV